MVAQVKKKEKKFSLANAYKNRLEKQKIQAYSEGLILAADVRKGKMSAKRFARRFYELKQIELFEAKTGLFTPYFFELELVREMAQAKRHLLPLSLLVIDMDKMKVINDRFGHLVGDKAILTIGKVLRKVIRQEDVPCRWGGDEFAVILPFTDSEKAVRVAQRIHGVLESQRIETPKGHPKVAVSIGVAQLAPGDTPDSFFEKADRAAYESKKKGGGKISVYKE